MDNLTHTLAALVLAKTRLGRASPMARVALVVSANAPDLDGIVGFWGGREAYLHHHRGLSHSVFGLAILAVLLWLLFRWVETWWPLEGLAGRARSRGGLLAAICVGLATHPLLDSLNGYGVRPWLPFDGTHYYGDLVFIVDPWLWCILGGAAALMGPRSRAGNWAWLSLAIAASGVVYLSGRAPSALSWLWPVAVAAIAAARIVGIGSRRPRAVLLAAAVAFAGYLGIQEAAGRLAQSRALEDLAAQLPAGERILGSSRAPQPGAARLGRDRRYQPFRLPTIRDPRRRHDPAISNCQQSGSPRGGGRGEDPDGGRLARVRAPPGRSTRRAGWIPVRLPARCALLDRGGPALERARRAARLFWES